MEGSISNGWSLLWFFWMWAYQRNATKMLVVLWFNLWEALQLLYSREKIDEISKFRIELAENSRPKKRKRSSEDGIRNHDLGLMRPTLFRWATSLRLILGCPLQRYISCLLCRLNSISDPFFPSAPSTTYFCLDSVRDMCLTTIWHALFLDKLILRVDYILIKKCRGVGMRHFLAVSPI